MFYFFSWLSVNQQLSFVFQYGVWLYFNMVRSEYLELIFYVSSYDLFHFYSYVSIIAPLMCFLCFYHGEIYIYIKPRIISAIYISLFLSLTIYIGSPKKAEPLYYWLKFIDLFLPFFFFRILNRFCAWKIGTIVFTNMSWSSSEQN